MSRIQNFINSEVTNSFFFFQPDIGTTPTPDSPNDTISFTSGDGSIQITGNSTTDTLDFRVAGASVEGFTTGSVLFAGSSGQITQNNTKFFWDNTLFRLIVGATGGPAAFSSANLGVTGGLAFGLSAFIYGGSSNQITTNTNMSIGGSLSMNGNAIGGVLNPVAAQDAATKNYVDTFVGTSAAGIYVKRDGTTPLTAGWSAGPFFIDANNVRIGASTNLLLFGATTSQISINAAGTGNIGPTLSILAGNGDGSVAGTGGGNLLLQAGLATGDESQNNTGGAVYIMAGKSKGFAFGGTLFISAGDGGDNAVGSTGGTGSDATTSGGQGGTNATNGGKGGAGQLFGGSAGAASSGFFVPATGARFIANGGNNSGVGGGFVADAGTGGGNIGPTGGAGGPLTFSGGSGGLGATFGGAGGAITIRGGQPAALDNAAGGAVTIQGRGGSSTGSGGIGGAVSMTGGNAGGDGSTARNGGAITITAGNGIKTGVAAAVTITAGNADQVTSTSTTTGGVITITGGIGAAVGTPSGGPGGSVTIKGGAGGAGSGSGGAGGGITIQAGAAAAAQAAAGGGITLIATDGTSSGTGANGGAITVTAGNAGGDGTSNRNGGAFSVTAGSGLRQGVAGAISLTSGNSTGGNATPVAGGLITLTSGTGTSRTDNPTGTNTSSLGGLISLLGGAGGAAVGTSAGINNGGGGAGFLALAGVGGGASNAPASNGGIGGTAIVSAGTGGFGYIGGTGGMLYLSAGAGGNGVTTYGAGGFIAFYAGITTSTREIARFTNTGGLQMGTTSSFGKVTLGATVYTTGATIAGILNIPSIGASHTNAYGIYTQINLGGSIAITNIYGHFTDGVTLQSGSTVLTQYGSYVSYQGTGQTCFAFVAEGASNGALWLNSKADVGNAQGGIYWGASRDTNLYRFTASILATDQDFALSTAGKGYRIKTGSNAKAGFQTLVAGSGVVATTAVGSSSLIFVTDNTNAGVVGSVSVSARTAGSSFTITSTNISDTSSVAWIIFDPT